MVHEGSFDDLDQTYGALGTYVSEHGIGLPGPIREHYATTDRAEVCWPIDGRPATSWTRAPSPNERPARSCEGRTGRRRGARANASARASRRARPWRPPPDVQRSRHAGGSRPEAISTSSTLVRRAPRSELAHTRRAAPRDYVQNSATERHRPERATATDRRICRRSATERDAPIDPSGGQPGAVTTAAPTRIVTNRPPTGRHVCPPAGIRLATAGQLRAVSDGHERGCLHSTYRGEITGEARSFELEAFGTMALSVPLLYH
jgi:hypothetical protein